jgi:predicted dehydrogenase
VIRDALNVAVIGAGRWGRRIIRACSAADRCRLRLVCDVDQAALGAVTQRAELTRNSADVLSHAGIDAVVIATPPTTHADLAAAALRAGKHVFVEKPLALNVDDAVELRDLARRKGRKLMVGHILRYHPAVDALVDLFGERPGESIWASSRRLSTGASDEDAWWSLAPHDISLLMCLFGAEPISISARREATCVRASLEFPHNRGASIVVGHSSATKLRQVLVSSTRRAALFDDTELREKLRVVETWPAALDGDVQSRARFGFDAALANRHDYCAVLESGEPLVRELSSFVRGVLDSEPIRTDVDEALRVVRVLSAGERSASAGGHRIALEQPAAA